jgi:branched-chain amino acid transport system permease protein
MNLSSRQALLVLVVVLTALPLALPNAFTFDVAIRIGLAAITAIGLNILMGFCGQISIGHAAFVAAGAYCSGILVTRFGCNSLFAIFAAACISGVAAFALARPILRLKGHALTIATLGLGLILNMILINEVEWTGGPDGMTVPPLSFGAWELVEPRQWYAVVAALLLGAVAMSINLFTSPAGRALRAIRGSEVAAHAAGVDVASFKARAFAISAIFACVAGSLTAHYSGFITPGLSSFMRSVELATMVVLGGMGSTFGALLGAALVTLLPALLGGFDRYELMLFGLVLMLTMIFLPRGIVPSLAQRLRKGER